jgi:hypothetical protein
MRRLVMTRLDIQDLASMVADETYGPSAIGDGEAGLSKKGNTEGFVTSAAVAHAGAGRYLVRGHTTHHHRK